MPIDTLKVDRSTRWGNPFVVARAGPPAPGGDPAVTVATAAEAVSRFEAWLRSQPARRAEGRAALRGRHLACWCALDAPCHADVWLRVANDPLP